jgi:hypothetical protein
LIEEQEQENLQAGFYSKIPPKCLARETEEITRNLQNPTTPYLLPLWGERMLEVAREGEVQRSVKKVLPRGPTRNKVLPLELRWPANCFTNMSRNSETYIVLDLNTLTAFQVQTQVLIHISLR